MPHSSEEPQIRPSVPGPRTSAGTARVPQPPRPAVPGPRPGPRPAPPRADRSRPGPGASGSTRPARGPAPSSPGTSTAALTAPTARIRLEAATAATAVAAADDAVDALLDEGRSPGDILVLTTGGPHPWAEHELTFGEDAYWRQQSEGGDVFYAHTSALARATGRPVVVVAVNGGTDAAIAETLPGALGKAGTDLVVCGDPEQLRSLL
ncbi:hypothetical protein [Streptomyces chumphonensis]|uniref:hypothetical protein n=1 Tax=Streptomyces chumphonensis TaxID=1214925 RepID=UPI003D754D21